MSIPEENCDSCGTFATTQHPRGVKVWCRCGALERLYTSQEMRKMAMEGLRFSGRSPIYPSRPEPKINREDLAAAECAAVQRMIALVQARRYLMGRKEAREVIRIQVAAIRAMRFVLQNY